jgi:MFS family permease
VVAAQAGGVVRRKALTTMSDHDPFSDPFSPESFTPAPVAPTPAMPSAPPPVASNLPPAPAPVIAPPAPVRKTSDSVSLSPPTVFIGSYAFAGIAALVLASAIALLVALSDFHARHQDVSGLVVAANIVAAVVVAAIVLWLGLFDERGRRWARTATWAVCGLAVGAAVAVFVLEPGNSVTWFGQLVQLGAGLTIVAAVASAVLLALPASNAYFHTEPQTEPKPAKVPAAWTPSQPPASPMPPPTAPTFAPDDDPFS